MMPTTRLLTTLWTFPPTQKLENWKTTCRHIRRGNGLIGEEEGAHGQRACAPFQPAAVCVRRAAGGAGQWRGDTWAAAPLLGLPNSLRCSTSTMGRWGQALGAGGAAGVHPSERPKGRPGFGGGSCPNRIGRGWAGFDPENGPETLRKNWVSELTQKLEVFESCGGGSGNLSVFFFGGEADNCFPLELQNELNLAIAFQRWASAEAVPCCLRLMAQPSPRQAHGGGGGRGSAWAELSPQGDPGLGRRGLRRRRRRGARRGVPVPDGRGGGLLEKWPGLFVSA